MSDTPRTDDHEQSQVKKPNISRYYATLRLAQQFERELNAAKAALSGRTASCSNCNAMAEENAAMREAIKEAETSLRNCLNYILELPYFGNLKETETIELAHKSLTKLKPHLK